MDNLLVSHSFSILKFGIFVLEKEIHINQPVIKDYPHTPIPPYTPVK